VDEPSERYNAEQLIRAAEAQGLAASERLIVDWSSLGLIDRPEHRGAGQSRGSEKGTWAADQKELFLSLLKKRSEIDSVGTLVNIPVWLWLVWGDRYVPLRQVRRALSTWALHQWASERTARRAARRLVADFDTREPRTRTHVIDLITEAFRGARQSGVDKYPDIDELRTQLERLGEGETIQVGKAKFSLTPAGVAHLVSARLEAVRHLAGFSDAAFHWARFVYNLSRTTYGRDAPELVTNERFGHLFHDTDLNTMFHNASLDLVTILGVSRTDDFDQSGAGLGNPQTWETNNLRMQISQTQSAADGYVLDVEISEVEPPS
jgi:hypothetical protein